MSALYKVRFDMLLIPKIILLFDDPHGARSRGYCVSGWWTGSFTKYGLRAHDKTSSSEINYTFPNDELDRSRSGDRSGPKLSLGAL